MTGTDRREKDVLTVHMMGDFWIALNGEKMKLPGSLFSKTMNLFILMLLCGEKGIERRKVLELLYGEEETDNDSGRLRVVAFRLKRQLIAAGLMTKEDHFNEKGIFRWMPDGLELQVDARMFETAAKRAIKIHGSEGRRDLHAMNRKEPEGKKQEGLLEEACNLYEGEFLTDLTSEIWVAENQLYYQELYFQCIRTCIQVFSESGQHDRVLTVVRKAARLYPYEEWFVAELDALIGMGCWKEALEASEQSVRMLTEELGIHPSRELTARIRRINARIKGSPRDLTEIHGKLREKKYESGGLYCDYLEFSWIYRHELRRLEGMDQPHCLMLCSVTEKSGEIALEDEGGLLEEAMTRLGKAIGNCLHRADTYTRYQKNQYLILLVGTGQEGCGRISSRIESCFRQNSRVGRYQIHYFHAPVFPETEGAGAGESD